MSREASELAEIFGQCSGNGETYDSNYDIKSFTVEKFIKELKAENDGCYRRYSKSSKDAIAMYKRHISGDITDAFSDNTQRCLARYVTLSAQERLIKFMADSDTRAVVADIFDTKKTDRLDGSSESCAYYNFYVFKKSGAKLRIEFNYTD